MARQPTSRGDPGAEEEPTRKPFLLRLPPDLMEALRAWAAQDLRSLNSHIEFLLREAVRRRENGQERESR
jgi:hypothetical protein